MTPNVELLRDLKAALVNLTPDERFNMNYFCLGKPPESPTLDCGAVCCAYGVGTTLPSWKEAGLILLYEKDYKNKMYQPSSDAREILGLTDAQWYYLFMPGSYPLGVTPLDVAYHIDVLLADALGL